jgi:hypothetical protein
LAPGSYSECPIAFLLSAILGQKKNWAPSRSTPEGLADSRPAAFDREAEESRLPLLEMNALVRPVYWFG